MSRRATVEKRLESGETLARTPRGGSFLSIFSRIDNGSHDVRSVNHQAEHREEGELVDSLLGIERAG